MSRWLTSSGHEVTELCTLYSPTTFSLTLTWLLTLAFIDIALTFLDSCTLVLNEDPWGQTKRFSNQQRCSKAQRGGGPPALGNVAKRKQKARLPLFSNQWRTTLVCWNISAMTVSVAPSTAPSFLLGKKGVTEGVRQRRSETQDRELKLLCKAAVVTRLWSDWLPWHVDTALPVHTLVSKYALSETLDKHLH